MYVNMHRQLILFPALLLARRNSNILSCHHSVSRSPQLDQQTNIHEQRYIDHFIHICWSANEKSIKVYNVRKVTIQCMGWGALELGTTIL